MFAQTATKTIKKAFILNYRIEIVHNEQKIQLKCKKQQMVCHNVWVIIMVGETLVETLNQVSLMWVIIDFSIVGVRFCIINR